MDIPAEIEAMRRDNYDLRTQNYTLLKENIGLQRTIQEQNIRVYDLEMAVRHHAKEIADLNKMMKQIQAGFDELKIQLKMQIEELREENNMMRKKLKLN